jgi:hypothetical protein
MVGVRTTVVSSVDDRHIWSLIVHRSMLHKIRHGDRATWLAGSRGTSTASWSQTRLGENPRQEKAAKWLGLLGVGSTA